MKRLVPRRLRAALAAFGLAILPAVAHAHCAGSVESLPGYDPRYYSVAHEFRRSKYVVEAQVERETWLGEDGKPRALQPPFQYGQPRPWGFDPYLGAYYDVRVLRVFKGRPPATLRLFSENSTARFWLKVGDKQVIFVTEGIFEAPVGTRLTLDTCGNSERLPQANGLLRRLAAASVR